MVARWMWGAVLAGCTATEKPGDDGAQSGEDAAGRDSGSVLDSGDSGDTGTPAPAQSPLGRLKIEEVYYTGSPPAAGRDHYFSDQYIALRNVSDDPVQLGGLLVGDLFGLAGEINPGGVPDARAEDPGRVVFWNLWQIPGAPDDVTLAPGGCVVIAQDAGDHRPYSDVDLLDADYESFVEDSRDDMDDAVVPNLESLWFAGGNDWLMTVFGPSVVIATPLETEELDMISLEWTRGVEIPTDQVIDTMEALMDGDSAAYKRLHPDIDAGFIYASGTYTGESVRRRSVDGVLQDTDDSGADFELAVPTGRCEDLR